MNYIVIYGNSGDLLWIAFIEGIIGQVLLMIWSGMGTKDFIAKKCYW